MKHTRPTISHIKRRINELEAARDYWARRVLEDSSEEAQNLHSQTLAALNELRALIGELK